MKFFEFNRTILYILLDSCFATLKLSFHVLFTILNQKFICLGYILRKVHFCTIRIFSPFCLSEIVFFSKKRETNYFFHRNDQSIHINDSALAFCLLMRESPELDVCHH